MFIIYIFLFFVFCGLVFSLTAGFLYILFKITIGLLILGAIILLPGIIFSWVTGLFKGHKD